MTLGATIAAATTTTSYHGFVSDLSDDGAGTSCHGIIVFGLSNGAGARRRRKRTRLANGGASSGASRIIGASEPALPIKFP